MSAPLSAATVRVYEVEGYIREVLDLALRHDIRLHEAFGSTWILPQERRFGDLAGAQRYVEGVLQLGWVQQEWPERSAERVRVGARRELLGEAMYRQGRISLPDHGGGLSWAMRELVVLHELAHHLTGTTAHAQRYREGYVKLVGGVMGESFGELLRVYFLAGLEE